jgi:hypothetical protein
MLFAASSPVFAQDVAVLSTSESRSPMSWFLAGYSRTNSHPGINAGLFFRFADDWAVGLRGGFRAEPSLFEQPAEGAWWINPMLQYTPIYGSRGMVSFGIGAGMTGGTRRGGLLNRNLLLTEYERVVYRVPSATLELQVAAFVTQTLGFTATGFANLNKEQNQTGFLLGLQLRRP